MPSIFQQVCGYDFKTSYRRRHFFSRNAPFPRKVKLEIQKREINLHQNELTSHSAPNERRHGIRIIDERFWSKKIPTKGYRQFRFSEQSVSVYVNIDIIL